MGKRTRLAAVVLGAAALIGTGTTAAKAMNIPQPPDCLRQCSPIIVDTTGPCYGVIAGEVSVDNFCYLGPPPIG